MTPVRLPGGTVDVSRLGFGCAYLTGGLATRASRRIVAAAIDAGVRHFDTAPVYGMGTSEAVLGAALAKRRAQFSIATKVGLPRPQPGALSLALRALPAPLRAGMRIIRPELGNVPPHKAEEPRGEFAIDLVRRSVTRSLAELQTDYVDLLLLHEARLSDVTPALIDYLCERRREGRFRAVGVGSDRASAESIIRAYPGVFDVVQYSWDVLDRQELAAGGGGVPITHRAVMGALRLLGKSFASDAVLSNRVSIATGIDVADPAELTRLLLGAALSANQIGLVLFGTRRASRIAVNVGALDERYLAGGAVLRGFVGALATGHPPAPSP